MEYRFFNCTCDEKYSEQSISGFDELTSEQQLEVFLYIIDKMGWDDTDDIHAFANQSDNPIIMYSDHDINTVHSNGESTYFSSTDFVFSEEDMSCD